MAVRNWWIEVAIDGSKTKLKGGPRAKDGGFDLVVKQRDEGCITQAIRIEGKVLTDGRLWLEAWVAGHGCSHVCTTKQ